MSVPALVDTAGMPMRHAAPAPQPRALNGPYPSPWAYDAASLGGPEMSDWLPTLRSPDGEIGVVRDRVTARNRDLIRNDGWASGGINNITDGVIGAQFDLSATPDFIALGYACKGCDHVWADEYATFVEAEWRMFAEDPGFHCDVSRHQSVVQMLNMDLRHKLVDGDGVIVLHFLPEFQGPYGARFATTLQVRDPDLMSNPFGEPDRRHLRNGVELDNFGAPVAYHFRLAHQGDWYDAQQAVEWERIPRETPWGRPIVVHDFDRERAGQSRGVSILTPILSRFRMLTKYDSAELQQAILQTIFATFVESPYDAGQVQEAMNDSGQMSAYQDLRNQLYQARPLSIGGVRVPVLAPGEKINAVGATRPSTHFPDFEHALLRSVAACVGGTAEELSRDYSRTNYSSGRMAMLSAWKTLVRRRGSFATNTANPVYGAWLEELFDMGQVPLPRNAPPFAAWKAAYARCEWTGPGRGWVDPVKERQGEVLGLDAGFGTLKQSSAEISGTNWRLNLYQRAREVALHKQLGLKLPDWAAGGEAANATLDTLPSRPA